MRLRLRPVLSAINNAPTPIDNRFWSKVDVRSDDDCWPWKAERNTLGYGKFSIRDLNFIASRIAYALTSNSEPGDRLVCHTCDNPPCCNPKHLWLGSDGENLRDRMTKGRGNFVGLRGEHHANAKLTAAQVLMIRQSHLPATHFAQLFGVTSSAVLLARRGVTWGWLESAA